MKTIFTRTVSSSSAINLVQGIVRNAADFAAADEEIRQDCACNGPACPCTYSDSAITADGFIYSPDFHSGANTVTFPQADTCLVTGRAGAGDHTLEINIKTGTLTVTHEGRRRSFPGNAMGLMPMVWFYLNKASEWKLVEYKSCQPNWAAIAGFVSGVSAGHGDRPENAEEADYMAQAARLKLYCRKAEAVGRTLPARLMCEDGKFWTYANGQPEEYVPPRWTGIEYRRAGAIGISL